MGSAMPAAGSDGQMCQADSPADCSGLLCQWENGRCAVKGGYQVMDGTGSIQEQVNIVSLHF
eukprot:UN12913